MFGCWNRKIKSCPHCFCFGIGYTENDSTAPGAFDVFRDCKESVGWKELCSGYSELWTEMQRQAINEENSIIMESRELYISDSFNGEESDFEQMLTPITEKLRMMEEFLSGENFPAFTDLLQDILSILVKAKRHSCMRWKFITRWAIF